MFGVVLTPVSPLEAKLPLNEVNSQKVRSGVVLATKSKHRILTQALILDSGANIHILNNPNFLSNIITCLGQFINTTGSRTLCDKMEHLYEALKSSSSPGWVLFSTKWF